MKINVEDKWIMELIKQESISRPLAELATTEKAKGLFENDWSTAYKVLKALGFEKDYTLSERWHNVWRLNGVGYTEDGVLTE